MEILKIVSNNNFKQNTYLVSHNNTNILIDCGASLNEINTSYKKATGKPFLEPISAILLTHCHLDHIFYLNDMVAIYNCPIYIQKGCESFISSPYHNVSVLFSFPLTFAPQNIKSIDSSPIIIGDIKITPFHTPGHSLCSTCFLIENALFTGDTLFYQSWGRTDLPGGSIKDLHNSIAKLNSINYTIAYPGHGIAFKKDNKSIKK